MDSEMKEKTTKKTPLIIRQLIFSSEFILVRPVYF